MVGRAGISNAQHGRGLEKARSAYLNFESESSAKSGFEAKINRLKVVMDAILDQMMSDVKAKIFVTA